MVATDWRLEPVRGRKTDFMRWIYLDKPSGLSSGRRGLSCGDMVDANDRNVRSNGECSIEGPVVPKLPQQIHPAKFSSTTVEISPGVGRVEHPKVEYQTQSWRVERMGKRRWGGGEVKVISRQLPPSTTSTIHHRRLGYMIVRGHPW